MRSSGAAAGDLGELRGVSCHEVEPVSAGGVADAHLRRDGRGGAEDQYAFHRWGFSPVEHGVHALVVANSGVVGEVGGEQVDGIPEVCGVGHDRGGHRDEPLEAARGAVPGVAALPGVEEDHGPTTGWSIITT